MVDPITILATLCAIISASHSLYEWRHHHLAKRLAANSGQPTEADKQLFAWLLRLWKKYNQIAAVLGKKFHMLLSDNTTNVLLFNQLQQIRPQLVTVQLGVKELESYDMTPGKDEQSQAWAFQRFNNLANNVEEVQQSAGNALSDLCSGIMPDHEKVAAMENEQLEEKEPRREFCDGAKLFQSGDRDEDFLAGVVRKAESISDWGYICNTCSLEVGYYPAVRISRAGKALDSSLLLTASHLNACKWSNRRAFYRCLECYANRKIVDFPSAVAFEKHMEKHPGFTMMNEQDENQVTGVLTQKEQEFLKGVSPVTEKPENAAYEEFHNKKFTNSPKRQANQALPQGHLLKETQQRRQEVNDKDDVSPIDEKDSTEDRFGLGFHSPQEHTPSGASSFLNVSSSIDRAAPAQTKTFIQQSEKSGSIPDSFPSSLGFTSPARSEIDSTSVYEKEGKAPPIELDSNGTHELEGLSLVNKPSSQRTSLQSPDPFMRPRTSAVPRRPVGPQSTTPAANTDYSHATRQPERASPQRPPIPSGYPSFGANGSSPRSSGTTQQSRISTSSNESANRPKPYFCILNGVLFQC